MSHLDKVTRDKIEAKVNVVFRDLRSARTPEEVVSGLVELSDFIDKENLTPAQLEELRGIGCAAMTRHSYMDDLNRMGVVMSFIISSMIAGLAITALYMLYQSGVFFSNINTIILLLFTLIPIYLLYCGKKWDWFSQ